MLLAQAERPGGARLLPSGDAYTLVQGAERLLLIPDADRRGTLWTPRVWPGGILAQGELIGTWQRSEADVTLRPWGRVSSAARAAVESEAESLPLPGSNGRIVVAWKDGVD
jgi:hypothetical protein